MSFRFFRLASCCSLSLCLLSYAVLADDFDPGNEVLIDATFNDVADGTLEEFSLISNGIGNPAWNNADGQASMSQNEASNGTTGCVSDGFVNGSLYSELTATFTIDSIVDPDGEPTNNGHWVGLTGNNTELWNNSEAAGNVDGWAVGIRFLSGNLNLVFDSSAGNEVNIASLGTYTLASLQDGYTVNYRFDANGWEVSVDGLSGTTDAQGDWPAEFDYTVFSNDSSIHASMTYQQANEAGTIVDVSSIMVCGAFHENPGPLFPFVDTDGDSYRDEAEIAFGADPEDPKDMPDYRTEITKPNIVIIYADDLGFGDVSAYGDIYGFNSPARTPNIDTIAQQGVTFTQGHSGNGVCTPSRYALLTGKYNWREFDGITGNWGGSIGGDDLPRADDVTIAEFLKTQQYDTAAFGKWHMGGRFFFRNGTQIPASGGGGPTDPDLVDWEHRVELHAVDHGFDHFRGTPCAINFAPYVYLIDDRMQFFDTTLNGGEGAYRPALNSDPMRFWTRAQLNQPILGEKGSRDGLGDPSYNQLHVGPQLFSDVENYIAERASSGDTDPFFAYVSMHSPHRPWALTQDFVGDDTARGFIYADWMREVDHRVGRVLTALQDNGFADNTIVIFTADNGTENGAMGDSIEFGTDSNGPLRGNKRDVWDGGTRVPFMVRWPGQTPAGMKVNDPIWQGDIFATLAAFLGSELPDTTCPDGESFLNLIRGQQKPQQRKAFVMSSIRGDLGLKTNDGWKFVDATGGGDGTSWDSSNIRIPSAAGTNRGTPKQLFHQAIDIGEDSNLILDFTDDAQIRDAITSAFGEDLLGLMDDLRTNHSTALFPRIPDNDGDSVSNADELASGRDPNYREVFLDVDVSINQGATQRSMLTSVEVTFEGIVEIGEGAFTLRNRDDGSDVPVTFSSSNSNNQTTATLSFSTQSGSLADGNYELTIDGDLVTDSEGDCLGGSFVLGDEEAEQFYRLFGDVDQNRFVNIFDLLGFRQTYLLLTGDASFNASFDFNSDGNINIFDLLEFRQNWLKMLPFDSGSSKRSLGDSGSSRSRKTQSNTRLR